MRNPAWTRDELILALDLYFRVKPSAASDTNPEVISLSETLNKLPVHASAPHSKTFRNANGVSMKLSNFLRFDPSYSGKGLHRGNKLEEEVWNEFSSNRDHLAEVAKAIRSGMLSVPPPHDDDEAEIDEEFPEGRVLTQLHKKRERNRKASKKKKAEVLKRTGALACEACGFDFFAAYGPLGSGFAECHHRLPLATIDKSRTTKLADLAIVCANCHRMLHRARPWKTVEELSKVVHLSR